MQAVSGTRAYKLADALKAELPASGCVNVDAAAVVKNGGPPAGAHSDIVHRELAQVVLAAGRIRCPAAAREPSAVRQRCEVYSTTCWKVGRFCQLMVWCLMPPRVRWLIESAHHWSPAEHRSSPG